MFVLKKAPKRFVNVHWVIEAIIAKFSYAMLSVVRMADALSVLPDRNADAIPVTRVGNAKKTRAYRIVKMEVLALWEPNNWNVNVRLCILDADVKHTYVALQILRMFAEITRLAIV